MKRNLGRAILLVCAVLFAMPIALTVMHSFGQTSVDIELNRLNSLVPSGFSLEGDYDLLIEHSYVLKHFWNTVIYAGTITLLNTLVSFPVAYAFSQVRFRGRNILFYGYVLLMMMPLQVTLLPNYIGLRDMGLLDTPFAIILPALFSPFSVFLMTQYMKGLDITCLEAARLETGSVFVILWHVVAPQIRTCIFAAFMFVFAEYWNLVEQPNIFLRKESLKPLSSYLAEESVLEMQEILAGSVIFMIPIVILYLYFHDSLEIGLGSMKL